MRKWIFIVVIVALFGYAVYDFGFNRTSTPDSTAIETEGEEGLIGSDLVVESGINKGEIAPDFELKTLDGEKVKLSDYRGEKVLLNFWATWCPPCRAEMPDMQKFHEDTDAVILAVNLSDTEQSMKNVDEFLEEYGITFEVLSDEDSSIAMLYSATALPTSYLINSQGEVHNVAIGALNYEMMVQGFNEMD